MDECLTVPSGEHGEEQRRLVPELIALRLALFCFDVMFLKTRDLFVQASSIRQDGLLTFIGSLK